MESSCIFNKGGGGTLGSVCFLSSSLCLRGELEEYHHCKNFNINNVTGRAVLSDDKSNFGIFLSNPPFLNLKVDDCCC